MSEERFYYKYVIPKLDGSPLVSLEDKLEDKIDKCTTKGLWGRVPGLALMLTPD